MKTAAGLLLAVALGLLVGYFAFPDPVRCAYEDEVVAYGLDNNWSRCVHIDDL
jgi:hypothetical protein